MPARSSRSSRVKPPDYAKTMFWAGMETGHAAMRWGGPTGPILVAFDEDRSATLLPCEVDSILPVWDGNIRIGGFVERLHVFTVTDYELAVVEIVGGAHLADHVPLASLDEMKRGVFEHPADTVLIGERLPYTFIMDPESDYLALAQDALVAGLAVDAVGRLASDEQALHQVSGLPLIMTSLTVHR